MLKNPVVGRPIVAGYNWILTPASIFVGHYLKKYCQYFDDILTDSLSLVKTLETSQFGLDCQLFTVDFKSLFTNIPVDHAIELTKQMVFQNQDVLPNAHFIIDLLEVSLKYKLIEYLGELFIWCSYGYKYSSNLG